MSRFHFLTGVFIVRSSLKTYIKLDNNQMSLSILFFLLGIQSVYPNFFIEGKKGSPFSIQPADAEIEPLQSASFSVRFKPVSMILKLLICLRILTATF